MATQPQTQKQKDATHEKRCRAARAISDSVIHVLRKKRRHAFDWDVLSKAEQWSLRDAFEVAVMEAEYL